MARLRSTDRDLLVAQRVLSQIRHPDKPELCQSQVERRQKRLRTRFIQENFGDGKLRTVQVEKRTRKQYAMYDMGVTFKINNVPLNGKKYNAKVHIQMSNIPGEGMTRAACIQDAKDSFRKSITKGLRAKASKLRNSFFAKVYVLTPSGKPVSEEVKAAVSELFRCWIGKQLFSTTSKIRKKFPKSVKHEEVRYSHICEECKIRKLHYKFNTVAHENERKFVCLDCRPYPTEFTCAECDDEHPLALMNPQALVDDEQEVCVGCRPVNPDD